MNCADPEFIALLGIGPSQRTAAHLTRLYTKFQSLEALAVPGLTPAHRDAQLARLCRIARHSSLPSDYLLFRRGQPIDSWFILLRGSVLIEDSMYLAPSHFGSRLNDSPYRQNDCLVLEASDLAVIDYADCVNQDARCPLSTTQQQHKHPLSSISPLSCDSVKSIASSSPVNRTSVNPAATTIVPVSNQHPIHANAVSSPSTNNNRISTISESSSGRGDSIVDPSAQTSTTNSSLLTTADTPSNGGSCSTDEEEEDEDEGETEPSSSSLGSRESLRDAFSEAICKTPSKRTDSDLQILFEGVQHLPAFSSLTQTTCRALCEVMTLAVIREAGHVVLENEEKLDTWSVVLNGTVEVVEPDGTIRELTRGDSFGVHPDRPTHKGLMRTVTRDCQFALIAEHDYARIMNGEEDARVPELGEGGRVLLVYETVKSGGRIVIKGAAEKLIDLLVALPPSSSTSLSSTGPADATYLEDFLLTYRTFLPSPKPIINRLLEWHSSGDPSLRSRVNRLVLLWAHNHFGDFESTPSMMAFVEHFDQRLLGPDESGPRRLFRIACSTKARQRNVVITIKLEVKQSVVHNPHALLLYPGQHQPAIDPSSISLPFCLVGGQDGFGIFVDQVDFSDSLPVDGYGDNGYLNLTDISPTSHHVRRADQLLAVNGHSVERLTPIKVFALIRSLVLTGVGEKASNGPSPTRRNLSLVLVYNPIQYYQYLATVSNNNGQALGVHSHNCRNARLSDRMNNQRHRTNDFDSSDKIRLNGGSFKETATGKRSHSAHTSPNRTNCGAFSLTSHSGLLALSNTNTQDDISNSLDVNDPNHFAYQRRVLSCHQQHHVWSTAGTDCVLRVWKASDSAGASVDLNRLIYLPLGRQTSALEVTRLAVDEFALGDKDPFLYSLFHVVVEEGPVVKVSKLADTTDDLAGRLGLNARYYLKVNSTGSSRLTIGDEVARSILGDSRVALAQLDPRELAIRLTLDDYSTFSAIHPSEFVEEVFGLEPADSTDGDSIDAGSGSYALGHPNLDRLTNLVNREAYWAPSELCSEPTLTRRVDLLKRFIKLASLCRDLRNFNTMFCLMVGLHQTAVERLKQTWDRLPNKYYKLYQELCTVLDPSRNFIQYRNLLSSCEVSSPMLPYLPLVLKDLTFIHLGNKSRTADGLINFVKLRMLAKEIRCIGRMCNVAYDVETANRLLRIPVGRSRSGWAFASKVASKLAPTATSSTVNDNTSDDLSKSTDLSSDHVVGDVNGGAYRTLANLLSASSSGPFGRRRSLGLLLNGGSTQTNSQPSASPKKLYDLWLTTVRIRSYLANVEIVADPQELIEMSHRVEPSSKDGKASTTSSASQSSLATKASVGEQSNGKNDSSVTSEIDSQVDKHSGSGNKTNQSTNGVDRRQLSGQSNSTSPSVSSSSPNDTPTHPPAVQAADRPRLQPATRPSEAINRRRLMALSDGPGKPYQPSNNNYVRHHHHQQRQQLFFLPQPVPPRSSAGGLGFQHHRMPITHVMPPCRPSWQHYPSSTVKSRASVLMDTLIPMPYRLTDNDPCQQQRRALLVGHRSPPSSNHPNGGGPPSRGIGGQQQSPMLRPTPNRNHHQLISKRDSSSGPPFMPRSICLSQPQSNRLRPVPPPCQQTPSAPRVAIRPAAPRQTTAGVGDLQQRKRMQLHQQAVLQQHQRQSNPHHHRHHHQQTPNGCQRVSGSMPPPSTTSLNHHRNHLLVSGRGGGSQAECHHGGNNCRQSSNPPPAVTSQSSTADCHNNSSKPIHPPPYEVALALRQPSSGCGHKSTSSSTKPCPNHSRPVATNSGQPHRAAANNHLVAVSNSAMTRGQSVESALVNSTTPNHSRPPHHQYQSECQPQEPSVDRQLRRGTTPGGRLNGGGGECESRSRPEPVQAQRPTPPSYFQAIGLSRHQTPPQPQHNHCRHNHQHQSHSSALQSNGSDGPPQPGGQSHQQPVRRLLNSTSTSSSIVNGAPPPTSLSAPLRNTRPN